jgi:hypothetical protein
MLMRELPDTPSIGVSGQTKTEAIEASMINAVESDSIVLASNLRNNSTMNSGTGGLRAASQALETAAFVIERTRQIDEEYSVSARLATVGAKVSSTTIATLQTAKQFEEDYHISQNVAESVKSSVVTAQRIEEDYHVTQTVTSAARNAVSLVSEYEERYQVQQNMKRLVSDGWEAMKAMSSQAIEYESRYQLSQRAGAALLDGLASAAEMAREASRVQWSFSVAKPAQSDPSPTLPANASV